MNYVRDTRVSLLTHLTPKSAGLSEADSLPLCEEEHQRIVIFSTWETDMGVMEIASFTDPCEELFHIHHFLWKL